MAKTGTTAKEKQLRNLIDKLKRDLASTKDQQKVFEKRLEFFQDANARLAVEMASLNEAVKFILEVATKIAEQEQRIKPEKKENDDTAEPKGLYG